MDTKLRVKGVHDDPKEKTVRGPTRREKAKQDIFKYIELYCNTQRMHSLLECKAPCDLERGVA